MLHTKAQLTFPAWLVTMFSMRLNEENQKEDCLVLQIQRLTNTVALMLLLGLTESRSRWWQKSTPLHLQQWNLLAGSTWSCLHRMYSFSLPFRKILRLATFLLVWEFWRLHAARHFGLRFNIDIVIKLHDGHHKTVDVRPLGKRKELIDFYIILPFRRPIQSSDD